MDKDVKIESVMHPVPFTIGLEQPVEVALEFLRQHGIRHLPVCEGGELRGILSERDIEFALRVDRADPDDLLVSDCYTADPYTAAPGTPLLEVVRKMAQDRIGCVVIVDKTRVIGIFTTVDACRVLAELLSK